MVPGESRYSEAARRAGWLACGVWLPIMVLNARVDRATRLAGAVVSFREAAIRSNFARSPGMALARRCPRILRPCHNGRHVSWTSLSLVVVGVLWPVQHAARSRSKSCPGDL